MEVEELEDSQELQDAVLTAYHVMTLSYEHGLGSKSIFTNHGRTWIKNWVTPEALAAEVGGSAPPPKPPRQGSPKPPNKGKRSGRRR